MLRSAAELAPCVCWGQGELGGAAEHVAAPAAPDALWPLATPGRERG